MATPTPAEIKASYQRTVEQTRANKGLSEEGKLQRIARAYVTTKDALEGLQSAATNATASELRSLEQKFMGPGSAPLGATPADRIARDASFRDALERASKAEDGELQSLLRRAKSVDDPLQVRAALTVALERSDVDTVNAWLDDQPEHVDKAMNRLFELRTTGNDLVAQMRAGMEYGGLEVPGELSHLGAVGIANVADATVSA